MLMTSLARVPVLRRGYRFQFEPAQDAHVLLYPEGMIKLNGSAAEILKQVDGQRDTAAIVAALSAQFPDAPDLAPDVLEFLDIAHAKHWIEFR
ncbi:pyrroloquinoline quinone biosynthesis peptide chaperone PqqD [Pseudomonas kuykendallii]|nr:pyrroloquinoline quinone biosynthesis peptide chaperone PqqD [Pseudomonas kuykendallii]